MSNKYTGLDVDQSVGINRININRNHLLLKLIVLINWLNKKISQHQNSSTLVV